MKSLFNKALLLALIVAPVAQATGGPQFDEAAWNASVRAAQAQPVNTASADSTKKDAKSAANPAQPAATPAAAAKDAPKPAATPAAAAKDDRYFAGYRDRWNAWRNAPAKTLAAVVPTPTAQTSKPAEQPATPSTQAVTANKPVAPAKTAAPVVPSKTAVTNAAADVTDEQAYRTALYEFYSGESAPAEKPSTPNQNSQPDEELAKHQAETRKNIEAMRKNAKNPAQGLVRQAATTAADDEFNPNWEAFSDENWTAAQKHLAEQERLAEIEEHVKMFGGADNADANWDEFNAEVAKYAAANGGDATATESNADEEVAAHQAATRKNFEAMRKTTASGESVVQKFGNAVKGVPAAKLRQGNAIIGLEQLGNVKMNVDKENNINPTFTERAKYYAHNMGKHFGRNKMKYAAGVVAVGTAYYAKPYIVRAAKAVYNKIKSFFGKKAQPAPAPKKATTQPAKRTPARTTKAKSSARRTAVVRRSTRAITKRTPVRRAVAQKRTPVAKVTAKTAAAKRGSVVRRAAVVK